MTAPGAYDMAGNVKEWCWNEARAGNRFILGGGSGEPEYMFKNNDARSPFERQPNYGFRCIKLIGDKPLAPAVDAKSAPAAAQTVAAAPFTEQEYQIHKRLLSYVPRNLDARVESIENKHASWRVERVSFNAAYGDERVPAIIFGPKRPRPPYQTVVYFPGAWARDQATSEVPADMFNLEPLLESGRAVVYPIYKGTYERRLVREPGPTAAWEGRMQLLRDLGRTIDYLETRADIQSDKLGYCGFSWGAGSALFVLGYENRLKVNILVAGGFSTNAQPEFNPTNYLPHITAPTLMLNGRHDFTFPVSSQRRAFELLGTPPEHKRHSLYPYGHQGLEPQAAAEAVAWLDRYLGPVK
jgi:eukaryotic-like serine/threonine-protein kinase